MAVTQANDTMSTKKNKTVRPLPKQKQPNSQLQQESKKEKSAKAPTEKKQAAASLEKQKIAEEIKLNVAAMGMDLLNNSSAAPTQINKVNNLIIATSPKGLGTRGDFKDQLNSDADDEKSPDPKI